MSTERQTAKIKMQVTGQPNGSRRVVETAISLSKGDRHRKWEDAISDKTTPSRRWDDSEVDADDPCQPVASDE